MTLRSRQLDDAVRGTRAAQAFPARLCAKPLLVQKKRMPTPRTQNTLLFAPCRNITGGRLAIGKVDRAATSLETLRRRIR